MVALDEVTGQMKWAYGPMVAANEEEAKMRFENAPAAGLMMVFAGYILDNIEGDTHVDTEYGIMAFESATGRIKWRTPICRFQPGKFAAGFAMRYRNRIRSFASPPTYHQGTVYYCTNAGAIAALDALSGQIKWLFRYPYYHTIHDATRGWGNDGSSRSGYASRLPTPAPWYNQRPLVRDEQVYFTPVASPFLMCVNRRDGKILWSHHKAGQDAAYMVGTNRKGELVMVYAGRGDSRLPAVVLLDPKTGRRLNMKYDKRRRHWSASSMVDLIRIETHPILVHLSAPDIYFQLRHGMKPLKHLGMNTSHFTVGARPFMTTDNQLYVTSFLHLGYPYYGDRQHITQVDMNKRQVVEQTDYYSPSLRARAFEWLYGGSRTHLPKELEKYKKLPRKDKSTKARIEWLAKCCADEIPQNRHKPFRSFSRVTFNRFGVPFELRFGTSTVEMIYDRPAVEAALATKSGPRTDFARAELAVADSRLQDAAGLLKKCLLSVSSENRDFRAFVKQLLYRVHKRLARSAIRAGQPQIEIEHVLGMSRTVSTLSAEMETLFALADAYGRGKQYDKTAWSLRSLISVYGHREYPVAPVAVGDTRQAVEVAGRILNKAEKYADNPMLGAEMTRSVSLMRDGLPLYFSAVSPLDKPLTVRAGDLAAAGLVRLQEKAPDFAEKFENVAEKELSTASPEEQLHRLWEFPATKAAGAVLDSLFEASNAMEPADARKRRWHLADAARVARLSVPEKYRPLIEAPPPPPPEKPFELPLELTEHDLSEEESINWLALEREGDRAIHPELAFLGGRVRKRFDNKFLVVCYNLGTGKRVWRHERIRLKGKGEEAGFSRAFVHGDIVVTHGLSDVLAFDLETGKLKWRFRTPFSFQIDHAVKNGDLLVLASATETIALYLPTESPVGEVVWQVKEHGEPYSKPYFSGNRLVSVRRIPFNVTVRYRATGKLIGRLDIPDLSEQKKHPLVANGPDGLPISHDGATLVVSDGWYYITIDTDRLRTVWKRLIDESDPSQVPPIRLTLKDGYLLVLKQDYDVKSLWMLDSRTGRVLWRTHPKKRRPRPLYETVIHGDKIYGIMPHSGQGYYFAAIDCKTGKELFQHAVEGYNSVPEVRIMPRVFGSHLVARVRDRQDFEVNVLDMKTGKPVAKHSRKGAGKFGEHGRVSVTCQNGNIMFLAVKKLDL